MQEMESLSAWSDDQWIPRKEMKDGVLYRIRSRLGGTGIWLDNRFLVANYSCGSCALDKDPHWDDGGCTKPIKELGSIPSGLTEDETLEYLKQQNEKDSADYYTAYTRWRESRKENPL